MPEAGISRSFFDVPPENGITMTVSELKRLKGLEEENRRLKQIVRRTGREFAGRHLDEWAYRKGVKLNFIRSGKPIENAFAESFNGRLRDECLNTNWFVNLRHARETIEDWRRDYNEVRPHSSLKQMIPEEYANTTAGF